MNTTDLVQDFGVDAPSRQVAPCPMLAPSWHELAAPVRCGIFRARRYMVGEQRLDGSWAGQKSGDVSSLSQLVLLFAYMEREHTELAQQAARAIKRDQLPQGGWSISPGGSMDVSSSVLAYFALKIAGEDACQPEMRRARQAIREAGGADAADAETRWWLALLGQIDYDCCPAMPPEWLLTSAFHRKLSAVNERRFAALSVVWSLRPTRAVELARGVRELFVESPQNWPKQKYGFGPQFSTAIAGIWSRCERMCVIPFRKRALERASFLLAEAAAETECRDAEMDELVWQWIALTALGYKDESPAVLACQRRLNRLVVVDADSDEARSQPETSLTADTALSIEALRASGVGAEQPPLTTGIKWLLEHRMEPIEAYRNPREMSAVLRAIASFSTDDASASTALPPDIRLAALRRKQRTRHVQKESVPSGPLRQLAEQLVNEFLARQLADGGWSPWKGAEASRRSRGVLRANYRRPPEVSAPDATGAMLEMLSQHGIAPTDPAMGRAVTFLRTTQRGDGSWDSGTGARFIHGTTWAVRGLIAAGAATDDAAVAAGVNWLLVHQHESGGWGEAAAGCGDGCDFVAAEATAIQTAWAVLALVAAGQADHDATRRGIEFLVDTQQDDGHWADVQLTVRDAAGECWYRNDLHSAALPLLALARWAVAIEKQSHGEKPLSFRLIGDDLLN